jgi:hypothetical protein
VSYAWGSTTDAGLWGVNFADSRRTTTNVSLSARSACYHV